jgi:MEMO1 family protein
MTSPVRLPSVVGRFYPEDAEELRGQIGEFTAGEAGKNKNVRAIGCVVPHAGYIYSGHVAGAVYARLQLPPRIVLLGPNHTGSGQPLAIMSEGAWRTPLGDAPIDDELAAELKDRVAALIDDDTAHRYEHSLEVQIPFLQALVPELRFVPICIGTSEYATLEALGQAIAQVVKAPARETLIIASSDLNHYEPDRDTRIKDAKAIERMLALDPAGLFEVVHRERISMCGYAPTVVMLTAALALGANDAELVEYATSADVSGDRNFCVGYAGIAIL